MRSFRSRGPPGARPGSGPRWRRCACPARSRTSWPRRQPPGSTASRSSSPTSWRPRGLRPRWARGGAARGPRPGFSTALSQPFRDFDADDPGVLAANLRRAERKFDVMEQLGTDLVLVCSSVSPHALDDDDRIAEQLRGLGARAAERGLRVCYEALAWGRFVNTYERSWEIVRRADHPAVGLCVDSFHILSRGSDPAGIADIPCEKLFFLQLADAPVMDMDVLQWSRPYPLFPGQGPLDPPALPRAGDVRPPPLPRPRPHGRLPRSTLAGGLQRRLPPVRPGAGGRGRAAVAPGAAGGDGRPALARGAP